MLGAHTITLASSGIGFSPAEVGALADYCKQLLLEYPECQKASRGQFANQEEHYRKLTFKEEYVAILKRHNI